MTLVCRCHQGGVSWRSPTTWRETVMSSSNPRSWSTRSRTLGTTRTCTESCSWTKRGQETEENKVSLSSSLVCVLLICILVNWRHKSPEIHSLYNQLQAALSRFIARERNSVTDYERWPNSKPFIGTIIELPHVQILVKAFIGWLLSNGFQTILISLFGYDNNTPSALL